MARPQTVSDEDILRAAEHILQRTGHDGFTLAEVAREVGLSRAAVILRFKSTKELKLTLTRRMAGHFQAVLESLPDDRSGEALVALSARIGEMAAGRKRLRGFFQNLYVEMEDVELRALEVQRGDVLRQAISERMPKVAIAHDAAVRVFAAHLGGSIFQWQALPESAGDARDFLTKCTREWLALAGVHCGEPLSQ